MGFLQQRDAATAEAVSTKKVFDFAFEQPIKDRFGGVHYERIRK
jgi:hypothetical protein